MTSAPKKEASWLDLQKRIFLRWVNNKLSSRNQKLPDIVRGWTGEHLKSLVEILSESQFEGKMNTNATGPRARFAAIANADLALKFAEKKGVHLEIKTSAENLVDGDPEQAILGLVWQTMLTFMKFGDDNKMRAREALLAWVKNQIQGYKGIDVKDFRDSFHNGLALCALIHKFRPRLIDMNSLKYTNDRKDWETNLKTAFAAANKYFGLDEYLTPQEFFKIDEKAMIVYVSEYYAGIAAQRKLDVASRRVGKLVKATQYIQQLKNEYHEKAKRLKTNLAEAVKIMEIKPDNTLAGAQKRLDEFYDYQTKKKSEIVKDYLAVEGIFNQLAVKLTDMKRPAFVPEKGLTLPELQEAFQPLEKQEQEMNNLLQKELRRQMDLVQKNKQQIQKFDKLLQWTKDELKYLNTEEKVESHGAADYQINCLKEHGAVTEATRKGPLTEMLALGKLLADEKYEGLKDVQEREKQITEAFASIDDAHKKKAEKLNDDLKREMLRERVEMWDNQHLVAYKMLRSWIEEKETQLNKAETIESLRDARVALDTLALFQKSRSDLDSALAAFTKLGKEILDAKHTGLSEYKYPTPATIQERETFISTKLSDLEKLAVKKEEVLNDASKREEFKEKILLLNQQHVDETNQLLAWINEKKAYLEKEEKIGAVREANVHLNLLDVYQKTYVEMTSTSVAALSALGEHILSQQFTGMSKYEFPGGEELKKRETGVQDAWKQLSELYAVKKAKVEDDLAREIVIEKVKLYFTQHGSDYESLLAWCAEKLKYLNVKETVTCTRDAATHLNTLSQFNTLFGEMTEGALTAFKKLGQDILDTKHNGKTQYEFDQPEVIKKRNDDVDAKWSEIKEKHAEKLKVLQDDSDREMFKEKLLLNVQEHMTAFENLKQWIADKETYLKTKETVQSVRDARTYLGALDVYERAFKENSDHKVPALKKMGKHILDAKYDVLTQYVYEKPAEIKEREAFVDDQWQVLQKLHAEKKAILEDDLKREEFAEVVVTQNHQHTADSDALRSWITEKEAYLTRKETVTTVREAYVQLGTLDIYSKAKDQMTKSNVANFKKLGASIVTARYEKLSTYVFPTPQEVKERETFIDEKWVALDKLYAEKLAILQDDLEREQFKEKILLLNEQHIRSFTVLKNWATEKKVYLEKKEEVKSIQDARVHLNLLDVFGKDKQDMHDVNVAAFKKLGQGVVEANYAKKTQWKFEKPEEVKARETETEDAWTMMDKLAQEKRKALEEALALEEKKEALRLKYAGLAGEILRAMKGVCERLMVTVFGYTLKDVEAMGETMAKEDKAIEADIDEKRKAYKQMLDDLKTAGVTENAYTKVTEEDFEKQFAEVSTAQKARQADYAKALEKEKQNDKLCKAFADLATEYLKKLTAHKAELMASQEESEKKVVTLEKTLKEADTKEGAALSDIKKAYDAVVAANIQSNPYTLYTYKDVDVRYHQFIDFLNRSIAASNDEIQNKKLRGVSKQQMEEIDKQFHQYDADKNGRLETVEFKACLYSLGIDVDMLACKKIMVQWGKRDDYILYDGFKEYMIAQMGDNDSKEDIKAGFKFIAHNKDVVDEKELAEVMPDETLKYVVQHAPNKSGKVDYNGFVDWMYTQ
eukprot:TRINITY_DN362_c0_g1_i3.p1 TRINITY_DN362_c0_g1~~TRINITY_DN362_c0_g1_i3.p1  ORF type:complete len:1611 (+),score=620.13 TRINITY_DN362_c0_g1_i3:65-4897(+)